MGCEPPDGPPALGLRRALATAGYRIRARSVSLPTRFTGGSRIVVRTAWANHGTAPTYDPWEVRLTFVRRGGGRRVVVPLGRQVTGLIGLAQRNARVGTSRLRPGRYDVLLSVIDPTGYSAPMRLANLGSTADGACRVGAVAVS